VRLAEIAQAPGGGGNDADEGRAVQQAAVLLAVGSGGEPAPRRESLVA